MTISCQVIDMSIPRVALVRLGCAGVEAQPFAVVSFTLTPGVFAAENRRQHQWLIPRRPWFMLRHCSIQALSAEATTVGTGFHFGRGVFFI